MASYAAYEAYQLYSPRFATTPDVFSFGIGPEDADLQIIEFLDYSCGYCRDIHPSIIAAVQEDGNVRYIPRPLPSYSKAGSTAARLFYAAASLGKHEEAHNELNENFGSFEQEHFPVFADAIGVSFDALADAYNHPGPLKAMTKNSVDFFDQDGKSTPTFFIGDTRFIPDDDMPTPDDFIAMFDAERKKKQ